MKFSQAAVIGSLANAAYAAPLAARGLNDGQILNYALTLEHLEDTFYRGGLAQFSAAEFLAAGFDQTFYDNLKIVSRDETTHVSFLTTALQKANVKAVEQCTYDFGYKDVRGFIATASVLEGVGVSAYLGAAADIMSKDYLTAAGSILTTEARHSSYIRAGLKEVPFAQPFDIPLSFNEVYTLASPFIVSCPPGNPTPPLHAFPALTLDPAPTSIKSGDTVYLKGPAPKGKVYAAFISVTGPTYVDAPYWNGHYKVVVPSGFYGQSYVVITTCNTAVTDDTTYAGPAILEIVVPPA